MSFLSKAYRGQTDIDFPKLFRPILVISGLLVVISVGSLVVRGLNLSIDFEGGAVWEVPSKTLSVAQATDVLREFGKEGGAKVQEVRDAKGKRIIRVQAGKTKNVKESQKIAEAYAKKVGVKVEEIGTNTVGPSWGSEITGQALKSLLVFLVVIAAYISWQLEWRMAVGALVAVGHDIIVTVGVYSVFGFEVTPATVISFLTILGYSLYDTVVVYDRIRDNTAHYDRAAQYTFSGIMRRSLNQVLMRSSNTTLVSILPVVSLLVVGGLVFGQVLLLDFSLALFVGLVSGAYSSIFIASPVVVWLKEREPKYARIRKRATDRKDLDAAEHIPVHGVQAQPLIAAAAAAAAASSTGSASGASTEVKAAQYQRAHPPRPRKQGKKR